MQNKTWQLTYDLITTEGVETVKEQFMYFETCIMTVNNLGKHCHIDNINISLIPRCKMKCNKKTCSSNILEFPNSV